MKSALYFNHATNGATNKQTNKQIKNMKISIADIGTGTQCTTDGHKLTVVSSGGCPAEDIIKSESLAGSAQEVADAILADWLNGYEGGEEGAKENGLTVEVETGDDLGVARA
jgi:hypothetical protein